MSCGTCSEKTKQGASATIGAPQATGGVGNTRHCPVCGKFALSDGTCSDPECRTRAEAPVTSAAAVRHATDTTLVATTINAGFSISLRDHTKRLDLLGPEPARKIGQVYAQWRRQRESYQTHYSGKPYWVQADGGDDTFLQREFASMDEARECFEDLATAPHPDFKRWQLR
jgi:hypothetical protein